MDKGMIIVQQLKKFPASVGFKQIIFCITVHHWNALLQKQAKYM